MILILMVSLCLSIPAQVFGASKGTVYVCTKMVMNDYTEEDNDCVVSMKYKKNGLLKKTALSLSNGLASQKYNYKYKKSKIRKNRFKLLVYGASMASGSTKYSYDKKGHLIKCVVFKGKKKAGILKLSYDKYGRTSSEATFSGKGKKLEGTRYERDSKGVTIRAKEYKKGKLYATSKYEWTAANRLEILTYDKNGNLIKRQVGKYEHNNPVQTIEYDSEDNITTEIRYRYKKIKTKKASAVKRQQTVLPYYFWSN